MPLTLDQLEEKLLALPAEKRERLATSLYDSLAIEDDSEAEFSPLQLQEFERRGAELVDGTAMGVPYEVVMKDIDELLRQG